MNDLIDLDPLDRRGRRCQLETLHALGELGFATEDTLADAIGGFPPHVGRRLRRYRRRAWVGSRRAGRRIEYFLRPAGLERLAWIEKACSINPDSL